MGFQSAPMLCDRQTFDILTHSPAVRDHIAAYRQGHKDAKKKLPAFCFHASFKGPKRLSAEAVPSGLVMIDLDHLTPDELSRFSAAALPAPADEAVTEVMLIHITPSGQGLRIVIKAVRQGYEQCRSISDYQLAFARKIGAEHKLDGVTTDPARLSFCPQASDIVYLNNRLWSDVPERTTFDESHAVRTAPVPSVPGTAEAGSPVQQEFRGIPLKRIFEAYFDAQGGLPDEGLRNTRYYEAARTLRYICDFNPATIAAHLPDVGLPYDEVVAVCASACQSARASSVPAPLRAIVDRLTAEKAEEGEDDEPDEADFAERSAKVTGGRLSDDIPSLFARFTAIYPDTYSEAIVLSLLPIVGTLATGLRAVYLDHEVHSPSFMTVVSAEQASGKSFTRNLVRVLLDELAEEDRVNREVEQGYLRQLRAARNSKKQPEQPDVCVRVIPPSISIAKLLQRLEQAHTAHLFSFAEELDTVIKSNRAGAWSAKMDMYRQAFDNSEYGQDFMSESSYSTVLKVYYNLLFCGTPRQLRRFLDDVENGLVSRFCFAFMPDQFGAAMPQYGTFNERDLKYIAGCVHRLREAHGTVDLSFLYAPLSAWLEEHRVRAIADNDRARDIFRRRSAVIGFRAALAVSPLYTRSEKARQQLTRFALRVATLTLTNQLQFAGQRLNQVLEESQSRCCRVQRSIYEAMADTFTKEDLKREMDRRGKSTPVRSVVYRWKKAGLILITDNPKVYIKSHGQTQKPKPDTEA